MVRTVLSIAFVWVIMRRTDVPLDLCQLHLIQPIFLAMCHQSLLIVDWLMTRGIAQHVIVGARVFKKVDYPTICCSGSALSRSATILQFQSQLNHCWGAFVIVLSVSDLAFSGLFCYVRSSSMFVSWFWTAEGRGRIIIVGCFKAVMVYVRGWQVSRYWMWVWWASFWWFVHHRGLLASAVVIQEYGIGSSAISITA